MIASPPTPLFTPDPTQVAAILTDLTSTEHSLADVAELHHTTIDAFAAWAARPEIQDRLRAIETLAAQRARLAATAHLPLAIGALADMLTAYRADESRTPMRGDLKSIHLAEIRRSNARRAANLIMRLARFSSYSPLPAGEGPGPFHPLLPGEGRGEGAKPHHFQPLNTATHTPVAYSPSLREGAGGRVPPLPPLLPGEGWGEGARALRPQTTDNATPVPSPAISVPYDLSVLSDLSVPSDLSTQTRATALLSSAGQCESPAAPQTTDLQTRSVPPIASQPLISSDSNLQSLRSFADNPSPIPSG